MTGPVRTIAQLAAEFGVTARAIRFYEAKGLLAPLRDGTARLYGRRDRARLALVLRGKRLGFSLAEVAEYLALYDARDGQVGQMTRLLERVGERVAGLEAQRRDLDQTIGELRAIEAEARAALAGRSPAAAPEAAPPAAPPGAPRPARGRRRDPR